MALKIGELKPDANEGMILDEGMSKEIYMNLNSYFSLPLQGAVDEANEALDKAKPEEKEGKEKAVEAAQDALDKARLGWKKLAYSIAFGVIEHIKSNMEIRGITTKGNVDTTVMGETKTAIPDDHSHEVDLPVKQENVVFTQNNDGTGHVE